MKKIIRCMMACFLILLSAGCQKQSYLEEHANQTIIEDVEDHDEEIMQNLKDEIKPYQRDSAKGSIASITLDELEQKLQNQETFSVCFVTTYCTACQSFHEILDTYLLNHHVNLYQVVLDEEETSTDETATRVQTYFKEFHTTPGIFYVANGRNVSYYDTALYGVNEELFDIWVQQNQIDKVKE